MVEVTRVYHFSAAHRLANPALSPEANAALYGACHRPHGHNYYVEVTLAGRPDAVTGMAVSVHGLWKSLDLRRVPWNLRAAGILLLVSGILGMFMWGVFPTRVALGPLAGRLGLRRRGPGADREEGQGDAQHCGTDGQQQGAPAPSRRRARLPRGRAAPWGGRVSLHARHSIADRCCLEGPLGRRVGVRRGSMRIAERVPHLERRFGRTVRVAKPDRRERPQRIDVVVAEAAPSHFIGVRLRVEIAQEKIDPETQAFADLGVDGAQVVELVLGRTGEGPNGPGARASYPAAGRSARRTLSLLTHCADQRGGCPLVTNPSQKED